MSPVNCGVEEGFFMRCSATAVGGEKGSGLIVSNFSTPIAAFMSDTAFLKVAALKFASSRAASRITTSG
jgi:hypothetical protein